ncbi:hypothetical protein VIBNISFn118_140060 [Vibrio nigripulchritudo SFn118]|nr:hypothetical protein VIBNISFn118_140060 [Vibrio nigripulchritudo SFn118]
MAPVIEALIIKASKLIRKRVLNSLTLKHDTHSKFKLAIMSIQCGLKNVLRITKRDD